MKKGRGQLKLSVESAYQDPDYVREVNQRLFLTFSSCAVPLLSNTCAVFNIEQRMRGFKTV